MEITTLHASKREELGTRAVRRLRAAGRLPGVLYGRKRDTVPLAMPLKELEHALAAGSRMVTLEIGGTQEMALLKDIQYDSMGDELIHVDLARVAMDEKVEVKVPLELHGTPPGVLAGGTLDHLVRDIEVACLPGDIPERIRLEVGGLEIGQMLCVRDIPALPGVEFRLDPSTVVAIVHEPTEAKEAAPVEGEAAATEPEVIGRRAAEEEEEEAEE